jgi:hypothetical protein
MGSNSSTPLYKGGSYRPRDTQWFKGKEAYKGKTNLGKPPPKSQGSCPICPYAREKGQTCPVCSKGHRKMWLLRNGLYSKLNNCDDPPEPKEGCWACASAQEKRAQCGVCETDFTVSLMDTCRASFENGKRCLRCNTDYSKPPWADDTPLCIPGMTKGCWACPSAYSKNDACGIYMWREF